MEVYCKYCGKPHFIAVTEDTQEVINELLEIASFICDECAPPLE